MDVIFDRSSHVGLAAVRGFNSQQHDAVESLQRCAQQWQQLLLWLRENRLRVLNECARADDDTHLGRLPGQAFALAEIIEALLPKR